MTELIWQPAARPAEAGAVVLWDELRHRVLLRLYKYSEADLQQLSIVLTERCWVIMGPLRYLPWLDGAAYAAHDRTVSELWLPTCLVPKLCSTLILQQLKQQYQCSPFLLWPQPAAVISLKNSYPLSRELLDVIQEQRP